MLELWPLGGLLLSLCSQLAMIHSVAREERSTRLALLVLSPLVATLVLMVFRPTWSSL